MFPFCVIESNTVDVDSTLLSLVKHLSRQEAVTDYLIKKIHSLEEYGDQCLSVLSKLSKQMSGMAKQLRALNQHEHVAGVRDRNMDESVSGDRGTKRFAKPAGDDLEESDNHAILNGSELHSQCLLPLPVQSRSEDVLGNNSAQQKQHFSPVVSVAHVDASKDSGQHQASLICESPPPLVSRHVALRSEDDMEIFPSDLSEQESGVEVCEPQTCKREQPENSQFDFSTPFYRHSSLTESSGYASSLSKIPKPNEASQNAPMASNAAYSQSTPSSAAPVARPILLQYYSSSPLPSLAIKRTSLGSVEETLGRYKDTKPHFLAGKLACEAVFGKDVLRQCTPLGCSSYPALPQAELYQIKQLVLNANPVYWSKLDEFEDLWRMDIIRRITYTCSRFRREFNKRGGVMEGGV